jgi:hypothetical protein
VCYFFDIIQFISLVPSNSVVKQVCDECVPTLKTFRRVASKLSLYFCHRLFNVTPLVAVFYYLVAVYTVHSTTSEVCTKHCFSATTVFSTVSRKLQPTLLHITSLTVLTLSVVSALSCYQYQYNGDRESIPPDGPSTSNHSTE